MQTGSGGAGEAALNGEAGQLWTSSETRTGELSGALTSPQDRGSSGARQGSWKSSSMEMYGANISSSESSIAWGGKKGWKWEINNHKMHV